MAELIHTIVWVLEALRLWRVSDESVRSRLRPPVWLAPARQPTSITNAISPTGICGLPRNPAPTGSSMTLDVEAEQGGAILAHSSGTWTLGCLT